MSGKIALRAGVVLLVTAGALFAQYDPPPTYYDAAKSGGQWLTGAALKTALNGIISSHVVRSYADARYSLQILDLDLSNPNNLILIYTGASVNKTWDSGVTWSREHQWPASRQDPNESNPSYSDEFNLRPINQSVNESRGNNPYGIGGGYWDPDALQMYGGHDRGDCSRAMFYMATCYMYFVGTTTPYLSLVNGMPSGYQMGDLAKMLEWHFSDPVNTTPERRRNHLIYSSTDNPSYYQGNRNPFIDHPEFVWTIWAGTANNSRMYLGPTEPPDGASTAAIGLLSIINGSPSASVTLNKTGSNPTTYDVLLAGDATSTSAGTGQAFIGGVQSRGINVSMATTSVGNKTGTVTIDNTDLTSAAAGQGSADGNDVITVTGPVLAHANASFTSSADQNTLTINFGSVTRGSGTHTQPFSVWNLNPTPGFVAALDLDSITPAGDSGILTTDLATFSSLAAGSSHAYIASFSTATPGTFQATYTLGVSDENLPGAQPGTNLVLTLQGTVSVSNGDFDGDSDVDQEDYAHLQNCLAGPTAPPPDGCANADLSSDNHVDPADVEIFITNMTGP